MLGTAPEVISGYFDADARHDVDAVVALFTDDAVVIDEGQTWRGSSEIRAWREGPASRYEYSTQLSGTWEAGPGEYLLSGTLSGNFPGGTANLTWRFTIAGNSIKQLRIAP
jgi:hypothetical protein